MKTNKSVAYLFNVITAILGIDILAGNYIASTNVEAGVALILVAIASVLSTKK